MTVRQFFKKVGIKNPWALGRALTFLLIGLFVVLPVIAYVFSASAEEPFLKSFSFILSVVAGLVGISGVVVFVGILTGKGMQALNDYFERKMNEWENSY